MWDVNYLYLFTGSKSVNPAPPVSQPEDTPYLLHQDLHYNQTHLNQHSLTLSNTHSVKQTLADAHSSVEKHVEILSATDAQLDTDAQLEIHLDRVTATDTHSSQREAVPGTSSDKGTAILVQVQQVSAVHAANTERYNGTAAQRHVPAVPQLTAHLCS